VRTAVARASGTHDDSLELRPLPSLDAAREQWEALEGLTANPFASWAFARIWWRHLGGDRPLRLSALGDRDGRLVAVLPLFEDQDGERSTLRFIGTFDADLLGPVCAPADTPRALGALAQGVRAAGARLVANDLPAGSAGVLGGRLEDLMPSPVIDLPAGGFEALVAGLSANHRKQVRARDRRLCARYEVRLREADERTLRSDLETLFALHRARWNGASIVYAGPRVAFHHELGAEALGRGWLRLRLLELDGTPVAASYALRVGDAEWHYQTGRDPRLQHASVGTVLQARCIRAACEQGARVYRMLRGNQRFKLRWANRGEPVETVVLEAG
jgi:CelD/BcsL family acetyltransferase involved in cellulose biosynthesis